MLKLKIKNLSAICVDGEKTTYMGSVKLNDLIKYYKKLGDDIYRVNVSGNLFGDKPNKRNKTYMEKPWVTGNKIAEDLDFEYLDAITMLGVFEIGKKLDNWFDINKHKVQSSNEYIDITRTGYIKCVMAYSYKKNQNDINDMDDFFDMSFDTIIAMIISESGSRVKSNFFTNKTNCNLISSLIENRLLKNKLEMV
jgi:hypothetical protein